jgi:DNA-binding MarR family transcriptional regulator
VTHDHLLAVWRAACAHPHLSALTTRQLTILFACDRVEWLLHSLAEHLDLSLSVVSRAADALEASGLLVKERQATDKRRVWLRITFAGRAALQQVYHAVDQIPVDALVVERLGAYGQ